LRDEIGYAFPDDAAARTDAIRGISELIAEYLTRGKAVDLSHRIDIANETGETVETITFSDLFVYLGEPLRLPSSWLGPAETHGSSQQSESGDLPVAERRGLAAAAAGKPGLPLRI